MFLDLICVQLWMMIKAFWVSLTRHPVNTVEGKRDLMHRWSTFYEVLYLNFDWLQSTNKPLFYGNFIWYGCLNRIVFMHVTRHNSNVQARITFEKWSPRRKVYISPKALLDKSKLVKTCLVLEYSFSPKRRLGPQWIQLVLFLVSEDHIVCLSWTVM